jgi:hypothetical protein
MRKSLGGVIAVIVLASGCSRGVPKAIPVPAEQMALEAPASTIPVDPNEVSFESGEDMIVAAVPETTLPQTTLPPQRVCPKRPQKGDPNVLPRYTRTTITMESQNTLVIIDADAVTRNRMLKLKSPEGNLDAYYVDGTVFLKMEGLPWVRNPKNIQLPESYLKLSDAELKDYVFVEKAEYEGAIVCHYRYRTHRKVVVKNQPGTVTLDAYFDDRWFESYTGLKIKLDRGVAVEATVVSQILEPFVVPVPG